MRYNRRIKVREVTSFSLVDKATGETILSWKKNRGECPLFKFCNCKTAMCRVYLPDESCYWYRYFKELINK